MAEKETMFERGIREEAESVEELMKEAAPKTPLEAAIDRATGFKPEDMLNVLRETEQADSETEQGDSETKPAEDETEQGDSETKPAEDETPAKTPAKRDWVKEAYECFVKDAKDIDPTDPVKAIEVYFEKNATDELKARCKAEGKDAEGCWKFIEAVAHKALGSSGGHIDPAVVYAIAMHWFEDVPKDWDKAAKADRSDTAKPKKPTTRKERLEERVSHGSSKAKAELRELKKKERAKAAKAKKPKQQQGFFFEMLESPTPEATETRNAEQESEVQG